MRNPRYGLTALVLAFVAIFPTSSAFSQMTPGVFQPPAASAPRPQPTGQAQIAQQHLMKGMDFSRKGKVNEAIGEFKTVTKLVPNSPIGYYYLGMAYLAKNDPKSAEPMLKKVAAMDPKNASVRMQLLQICLRTNRPAEAVEYGQQAAKMAPKDPRIHLMLGAAYMMQQKQESAIKEMEKTTQLDPKNMRAWFNLGIIYYGRNDFGKARQALAKASALSPGDPNIVGLQAAIEEKADKDHGKEKAIAVFKKALAANPKNPQFQYTLGTLYERSGQRKLAVDSYQKVLNMMPTFMPAKLNMARIYLMDRDSKDAKKGYEKARTYLREAVKMNPNAPQPLAMLGLSEVYLDDNKNAQTHYEKALKLDPNNMAALEGLSYLYQTSNKQKQAAQLVEKIYAQHPESAEIGLRLAGMYSAAGDTKKASGLYSQLVEKFPKDVKVMEARATYLEQQKLLDKAADQYRDILKVKPDDLDTMMRISYIYAGSDDKAIRDKAIPELEAAKKVAAKQKPPKSANEPDNRITPFRDLANLYDKDGEKQKAVDQYTEYLKLDPKSAEAHQGMAALYEKDPATVDKAIDEYLELTKMQPDNRGYYKSLGMAVKKKTGKDEDEVGEYRKLIESDPKNVTVRYVLAETLAAQEGAQAQDDAIKEYNEILKIKPDDEMASIGIARAYDKQKKVDEAIAQYKQILAKNPSQGYALRNMQNLVATKNDPKVTDDWLTFLKSLLAKKETANQQTYGLVVEEFSKYNRGQEAATALEEISKKDSKDIPAVLATANAYDRIGQQAKALTIYKKVLGMTGIYENYKGDAYKGIGNIYFAQGKYPEALKNFQSWKSRQMFFMGVDDAQIKIAQCLERMGQKDKALAEYKNLANADPRNQMVQDAIKRLSPTAPTPASTVPSGPVLTPAPEVTPSPAPEAPVLWP